MSLIPEKSRLEIANRGLHQIEKGVNLILEGLSEQFGLDIANDNFIDTPRRVASAYAEMFKGLAYSKTLIDLILGKTFPCESNGMVIQKSIKTNSMCPHHLLPCFLTVDLAYIPGETNGTVLGLSKPSRIVEILAKRPVLQEQFTADVANTLMRIPGCQGVAVIVEGVHTCMLIRGVKQSEATTITSKLTGIFEDDASARAEFHTLLNLKK